jgi:hypothetical protein
MGRSSGGLAILRVTLGQELNIAQRREGRVATSRQAFALLR